MLRQRAWSDAIDLYDAADAEQRSAVFARIERDAMIAIAAAPSRR